MKLASTEVIRTAADWAHRDLDRAVALWPFVAAVKLYGDDRGIWRMAANGTVQHAALPTAEHGATIGDHVGGLPDGTNDDWEDQVAERVAAGRVTPEQVAQRAELAMLDAIDRLGTHARGLEDAIRRCVQARAALAAVVPAVDAAIHAGQDPTDGRTGMEHEQRHYVHTVVDPSLCKVCDRSKVDTVVPGRRNLDFSGRIEAGMCPADHRSWLRWGRPSTGWMRQWRAKHPIAPGDDLCVIDPDRDDDTNTAVQEPYPTGLQAG